VAKGKKEGWLEGRSKEWPWRGKTLSVAVENTPKSKESGMWEGRTCI